MNEVIFTGEDLLNIVIIAGILIGLSISLTTVNLWNACSKKKCAPRAFAISTLAIGYVLYLILLGLGFSLSGKDGTEAVLPFELHNTIDSAHMLSFALPCLVGIAGLLLLLLCKPDSLPPLVAASAIAAVYLGNLMQVLYAVQITKQVDSPVFLLLYLYHFNLLLLSVQGIRKHLRTQVKIMQNQNTKLRHKWVQKLYHFLENVSHIRLFTFALIVPLVAILEIILILCGQGLDGVMKAFTQTADWTFSTQIPPPPLEYEGHYLCTVAAGGHPKLVRPERMGMRQGAAIMVNRQLAIANAFEELLQQKLPRFHKWVRMFYDRHGYPISKHITTPFRADMIYILMKPLEWIFLTALYALDSHPEQRIATQYPWDDTSSNKNKE